MTILAVVQSNFKSLVPISSGKPEFEVQTMFCNQNHPLFSIRIEHKIVKSFTSFGR